jgi:hypothetical protein
VILKSRCKPRPKGPTSDKAVTSRRTPFFKASSSPSTHKCENWNTSGILRGACQGWVLWASPGWFCPWTREIGCSQEWPGLDGEAALLLGAQSSNLSFLRNLCKSTSHLSRFIRTCTKKGKGAWMWRLVTRTPFAFWVLWTVGTPVFRWKVRGC